MIDILAILFFHTVYRWMPDRAKSVVALVKVCPRKMFTG